MNTAEVLATALHAIRGNWLRSGLTALGIVVGIAAVMVMMAVGEGTARRIESLVAGIGATRVDITGGSMTSGGAHTAAGSQVTLTDADVLAIRRLPDVVSVYGSVRGGSQAIAGARNAVTTWEGVEPAYFDSKPRPLAAGHLFGDRDYRIGAKVAILGADTAQNLFQGGQAVGRRFRLGRASYEVVGVLEREGEADSASSNDDIVLVPLRTARQRLMGATAFPANAVQRIVVKGPSVEAMEAVTEAAEKVLRRQHRIAMGEDDDFTVMNFAALIKSTGDSARSMSLLLAVVAGVSLLIAGVGIMNIMLVSVTERTREIGLRLAVGAEPADITRQFLAEALLISLAGGAVGMALGVGGAALVKSLSDLDAHLSWVVVATATACAVGTGLFFGYYPASKAARLNPIEALRYE